MKKITHVSMMLYADAHVGDMFVNVRLAGKETTVI